MDWYSLLTIQQAVLCQLDPLLNDLGYTERRNTAVKETTMPCYDSRDDTPADRAEVAVSYNRGYTDGLADSIHNSPIAEMLCTTLTKFRLVQPNFAFTALMRDNPELQTWWNEHKLRDRKKAEAEKERKQRLRAREAAMNKLTAAERRILGLK